MNHSVQNVLDVRARLGECPVWDGDRNRLFWVDVYNHRIHQLDAATVSHRYFNTRDVVSAIVLADEDRLLMALGNRIALLNLNTSEIETLHQLPFPYPNTRFNDGKCDSQGRFWIGSISEAPEQAELYRYDPDGVIQVMETGLTISNGLGWSPDESTFYLTDSAKHLIYAYDYEMKTGTICNRRIVVNLVEEGVEPDGLAIDTQGNIWSALWNGWCVACFSPSGTELFRVKLPVQRPTSVAFGGPNLSDLYITSASIGLSQKEIQQEIEAGDLFQVATESSGRSIFRFGG